MTTERSMYTLQEAAKLLSVHEVTLRRSAKKSRRYGATKVGGDWRYPRAIIDAIVRGDEPPEPKQVPAGTPGPLDDLPEVDEI